MQAAGYWPQATDQNRPALVEARSRKARNGQLLRLLAAAIAWLGILPVQAATDWSAQDYDLYPGDFDGDGKTDVLYVAKDPAKASGIAKSDASGALNAPWQSWPSNYLGIPWSGNQYIAHVGDFNKDGQDDVFLQRSTPGDHYLLFTDANGKLTGIAQTVSNSASGVTWSADKHRIIVGDFDGDDRSDLFLQARAATGIHALVIADIGGRFTSAQPQQSWTNDSWGVFNWSTQHSIIFAGDFNGDGRSDLLIQAKPTIVLIDYDVPIPVPTHQPNTFGVVLSQGGASPFQQLGVQPWSRDANGVDWSPNVTNVIVGDFNGDDRDDVLLQSRNSGRPTYLLNGNAGGDVFSSSSALSANVPISSDRARLLAGNFDGSGGAGIYIQARTPDGTNYVANAVGSSITASAHNPSAATGVVPATAVGRTKGTFEVSTGGAATYSIPIEVPPGIRGIQPNLALVYSSNGSNGLLGTGWTLSGLSQIDRCGKTFAQDGLSDGVKLTPDDRLCLNGNRLRWVSGTYGYAGSTYRSEIEQFSRITAEGTAGNAASSFKIEGKNGLYYRYGSNSDSRIEVPGTTSVRAWALNEVSDRAGNTMQVSYYEENGSFRPKEIFYTSNIQLGITATHKVVFVWEARPSTDRIAGYYAGGLIKELNRLNRVEIRYNGMLIKRYQLSYGTSSTTSRSRLASVQECDRNDHCLSPTMIAWQEGRIGFGQTQDGPDLGSHAASALPIDVNGDGRADLAYPMSSQSHWGLMLANTSGGWTPAPNNGDTGVDSGQYGRALPMDYNADGRMDLLVPNSSSQWRVLQSTGSGFTEFTPTQGGNPIATSGTNGRDIVADFNGDGRDDLISIPDGGGWFASQVQVRLNSQSGFVASTIAYELPTDSMDFVSFLNGSGFASSAAAYRSSVRTLDVNADGKADLLLPVAEIVCSFSTIGTLECGAIAYWAALLISTGNSFQTQYIASGPSYSWSNETTFANAFSSWRLLDANGDGLTDVAYSCSDKSTWCLRFGTGVGLSAEVATGIAWSASNRIVAADWNGDGRTDLLQAGSGNWQLAKATGDIGAPYAALVDTGIAATGADAAILSDLSGDGVPDLIHANTSNTYRLHQGIPADRVSAVTDGFGNNVTVEYSPLTNAQVYTKGSGASYPLMDTQVPRYVVSRSTATDGVGGQFSLTYAYEGAKVDLAGRGFLGFAAQTVTDGRNGVQSRREFSLSFPYVGMLLHARQEAAGKTIQKVTTTLARLSFGDTAAHTDAYYPYVATSTLEQSEVGATAPGDPVTRQTTAVSLDNYGNAQSTTVVVTDLDADSPWVNTTSTVATTLTIANNIQHWCLGVPEHIAQAESLAGTSRVQTTAQSVDYEHCRVTHQVIEPNATDGTKIATQYTFGSGDCGNPTAIAVTGQNPDGTAMATRTTTLGYGTTVQTKCRFPRGITDPAGNVTQLDYYYDLGVLKSQEDANHLVTILQYDGFGRRISELRPDNTKSLWSFEICSQYNNYCGISGGRLQVRQVELAADSAQVTEQLSFFDGFDRLRLAQQQRALSPTGYAWTYVSSSYDNLGRKITQSQPYSGLANGYHRYSYDLVGRLVKDELVTASGTVDRDVRVEYQGRNVLLTNAKGRQTEKIYDAIGNLRRVIDPAPGGTTNYSYAFNAQGMLVTTVVDMAGNSMVTKTNRLGDKRQSSDPDMGVWNYEYNSLGELLKQTDAKGQQVTFTYDLLSRLSSRTDPGSVVTNWNWGNSASGHNIDKLESVAMSGYLESYAYDSAGRPQTVTFDYGSDGSYQFAYAYNNAGLLDTLTYPTSTGNYRLTTKNVYANGQLVQVKDNQSGSPFWTMNNSSDSGLATDESFGNGMRTLTEVDPLTGLISARQSGTGAATANLQNLSYQWDLNGNLTQRTDHRQSDIFETFTYDALDRLETSTVPGRTPVSLQYTAIGNIKNKTDVSESDYNYTDTQPGCSYYSHSQPHAVRKAGGAVYCYDPNGNMTSRNGSTITWTSFNMPSVINSSSSQSSTFTYTPNRDRKKQVAVYDDHTETTIYVGGLLEKLTMGGTAYFRHYIPAGSGRVIHTRWGSSSETYYVATDHLGGSNAITNGSGNLLTIENFDAFGQRRGQSWGTPTSAEMQAIAGISRDGYTGHEHLDNIGLIHMNGRIQDPKLGRFISADPFVQAPDASQSLNRYSYTWNNPLSATDPSGYVECNVSPEEIYNSASSFCVFPEISFGTPGAYFSAPAPSLTCNPQTPPAGIRSAGDYCADVMAQWDAYFSWLNSPGTSTRSPASSLVSVASGSTDGGFANDGVMSPIYVPGGTVAMNLPNFLYQQCAMSMCHGNVDLPFTHGYLTDAQSREFAMNAGLTVGSFAVTGVLGTVRTAAVIDTAAVRFTQSSVSGTFSDGRALQATIDALRGAGGDVLAGQIPAIRVFRGQNGLLYTLDNRRLLVFSAAGRPVPFRWATADEIAAGAWKQTATREQLEGWFIRVKP